MKSYANKFILVLTLQFCFLGLVFSTAPCHANFNTSYSQVEAAYLLRNEECASGPMSSPTNCRWESDLEFNREVDEVISDYNKCINFHYGGGN